MQLIPLHKIINVLTAASQKLTCFVRIHNSVLYKTNEIFQRKRNVFTFFV